PDCVTLARLGGSPVVLKLRIPPEIVREVPRDGAVPENARLPALTPVVPVTVTGAEVVTVAPEIVRFAAEIAAAPLRSWVPAPKASAAPVASNGPVLAPPPERTSVPVWTCTVPVLLKGAEIVDVRPADFTNEP